MAEEVKFPPKKKVIFILILQIRPILCLINRINQCIYQELLLSSSSGFFLQIFLVIFFYNGCYSTDFCYTNTLFILNTIFCYIFFIFCWLYFPFFYSLSLFSLNLDKKVSKIRLISVCLLYSFREHSLLPCRFLKTL